MSTDNWGICPKCKQLKAKEVARKQQAIDASYGVVSSDESLAKLEKLRQLIITEDSYSLQEDYEIETDAEGTFAVLYRCHCDKCGFSFEFKHKKEVPL